MGEPQLRERQAGLPDRWRGLRPKNNGCYQKFQGGDIHWTSATGAQATYGAIKTRWASLSYENGKLGYPTGGEVCGIKNNGCYQRFQGGDIHWSPTTGAQATWGAIRTLWGSLGYENGRLGTPSPARTAAWPAGGTERFQGGNINYTPARGAYLG